MMEPLISIQVQHERSQLRPGETLTFDYQIDAVPAADVQAVESSVLWYTEGKGEEDMGVHHFERRVPGDADESDLRRLRRSHVPLPNSPLSFDGTLVKIRWCVRVRVFMPGGREVCFEQPFRMGNVPRVEMPDDESDDDATDAGD